MLERTTERRQRLREFDIAAQHLGRTAGRPSQQRQMHVARQRGRKHFAEGVDQLRRTVAPARRRLMLLDAHLDARRPLAAHFGAPHPGQTLERQAQRLEIDAEEVAAQQAGPGQRALHFVRTHCLEPLHHHHLAQRKQRQPGRGQHRRGKNGRRPCCKQQVGQDIQQVRFVPHAQGSSRQVSRWPPGPAPGAPGLRSRGTREWSVMPGEVLASRK